MKRTIFAFIIIIYLNNINAYSLNNLLTQDSDNAHIASPILLNNNNISIYFTLNKYLSGDSASFGSLINYENIELSNMGNNDTLNYTFFKFGLCYDRILFNYDNVYFAFKFDIGYSFIYQDYTHENYSHENSSLLLKYPYSLFGPEITLPLGKIKNTLALSFYYQFGIIKYGTYKPLSSIRTYNEYSIETSGFDGYINNIGISINLYTNFISSKLFVDFINYNYSFDNLTYKYQGNVSKAYLNELCFGISAGFHF